MRIPSLIEEMNQIRNESVEDMRKLQSLIGHQERRYHFYCEHAAEADQFSELADAARDCRRLLSEALDKSFKTVEATQKLIDELAFVCVPPEI